MGLVEIGGGYHLGTFYRPQPEDQPNPENAGLATSSKELVDVLQLSENKAYLLSDFVVSPMRCNQTELPFKTRGWGVFGGG